MAPTQHVLRPLTHCGTHPLSFCTAYGPVQSSSSALMASGTRPHTLHAPSRCRKKTHLKAHDARKVRLHVLVVQDGEAQVVVQEELDLGLALHRDTSLGCSTQSVSHLNDLAARLSQHRMGGAAKCSRSSSLSLQNGKNSEPPTARAHLQSCAEADREAALVRLDQRVRLFALAHFDHGHGQIVQNPGAPRYKS